jgi:ABC-type lipoprotein release transport system permease subunit
MKSEGMVYRARIAMLFLVRSGRATVPLAIMVITAVAALVFLSALAVGVNDAMLRNTVGLFPGHITGYELSPSLQPDDLMAPGVKGVLKRVWVPGIASAGDLYQPLRLCAVDPGRETALTALQKKIVSGRYPQNGRTEVLIGAPLASQLGVREGDTLRFSSPSLGRPLGLTVTGIYESRIERLDNRVVFCPLSGLPPQTRPWSAAVFLRQGGDPQKVIDFYHNKWPGQYRFESWETLFPDLRQLIDLQYLSMGIVNVLVFAVVAIGIGCSFVIFIIKNIREYGIMKAMGVTNWGMTTLIMMKVVLMNLFAACTGLLIGVALVWGAAAWGGIDLTAWTSHNRYFSVSGIIYPRLTVFSLLAPPLTAFSFSLLAALWPAGLVARKKAADIIRMI